MLVKKAKEYATKHHAGQKYGDIPYTFHLRSVCLLWDDLFGDNTPSEELSTYMATCWLHDVIEDCESVNEDSLLAEEFPLDVVYAVGLVSKDKEGYNYEEYLKKISENTLAFQVKVTGTYSNLTSSMKEDNVKRVIKYSNQLKKLYEFRGEL